MPGLEDYRTRPPVSAMKPLCRRAGIPAQVTFVPIGHAPSAVQMLMQPARTAREAAGGALEEITVSELTRKISDELVQSRPQGNSRAETVRSSLSSDREVLQMQRKQLMQEMRGGVHALWRYGPRRSYRPRRLAALAAGTALASAVLVKIGRAHV